MPLVAETPNRPKAGDPPGLHAFIVGVSDYPDLPAQGEQLFARHFGMDKLDCAALSAYRVFQWLTNPSTNLQRPLATCRLLVSPSQKERDAESALTARKTSCTPQAFLDDARDWREDASMSPGNVTFFYFAGHGVRRTQDDSVLLLEGFGNGIGGALVNAVALLNIMGGMAVTTTRPNMALTQLYFIDACRNFPNVFKHLQQPQTTEVFDVELSGEEKRAAPIYFAAASGTKAACIPGQQTLFSEALIRCLTNDGADLRDDNGVDRWMVSVRSLQPALEASIADLNTKHGLQQQLGFGGIQRDATICELPTAPTVDVTFKVEPPIAAPVVRIIARDGSQNPVPNIPVPLAPHPFSCQWPAGFYTTGAEIDPALDPAAPAGQFKPTGLKTNQVKPPRWDRTLKVAP
jgi:hypothetical protein